MSGPRILCVAGDDPGAGAGLQQDRAMVERLGGSFLGVVAVRTVQDQLGLHAVTPEPAASVAAALRRALDQGVDAVKTGALGNAAVAEAVADALLGAPGIPLVIDPVRAASNTAVPGVRLLDDAGWEVMRRKLFPLAAVVTPNLFEYGDGRDYTACAAVLLSGGHGGGDEVVDQLLRPGREPIRFAHSRLPGGEAVHGTGCALSSALATELGRGAPPEVAALRAIQAVRQLLQG